MAINKTAGGTYLDQPYTSKQFRLALVPRLCRAIKEKPRNADQHSGAMNLCSM